MQIKNNIKIHNRFDIEIVDKNTGEVKQSLVSYNIVLSQMYTRLCGGLAYFANIHFGSGTGTLSPSRTTLFSHLGTKSAVDEEIIKAIPLSVWKRKIVLNPEEYVGNTISEVGIAFGSTNTNLVTHSLLKDSEGNTISIVKTDVDVITIYATVFVTFDISNSKLTYLSMPSSNLLVNYLIGGGTAPTGAINVSDCKLARYSLGSTATVTWTSDTANKQRKTNVPRFATTVGNGHIKFLSFPNVFELELPSVGIFAGQNYSSVSLGVGDGVKKEFKIPSANIRDSSLVVKLNGVATGLFSLKKYYGQFRSNSKFINAVISLANGSGASTSLDGSVIVLLSNTSPYVVTYDFIDGVLIARNAPLDIGMAGKPNGCYLSDDGLTLVISCGVSPYIYVYDWNGVGWIKRANPSQLPTNVCYGVSLSSDKLTMAVATAVSPYIITYDWIGGIWVKRDNPNILPSGSARHVVLSSDGSIMAVGVYATPCFSVYDKVGSGWIKRSDASIMPTGESRGLQMSKDGLVLSVYQTVSPYLYVYDWDGSQWVKRVDVTPIPKEPSGSVSSPVLAMNDSGTSFALGSATTSNDVKTYESIQNQWIENPFPTPAFSTNNSLHFSKNGKYIIVFSQNDAQIRLIEGVEFTIIKFNTPPAVSDVITADYIVDGVHKTDQYVIDASFAIQFGEI